MDPSWERLLQHIPYLDHTALQAKPLLYEMNPLGFSRGLVKGVCSCVCVCLFGRLRVKISRCSVQKSWLTFGDFILPLLFLEIITN